MSVIRDPSGQVVAGPAYVIARSDSKQYRFSAAQKLGIALLTLAILACTLYIYMVSEAAAAWGILLLYLALLGTGFRQITRNRRHFLAMYDRGMLVVDFDLEGNNDRPEHHRIAVPVAAINGYKTRSFLGGRISHVVIRFAQDNALVSTRPILVESLDRVALSQLLSFLDAQVGLARRLG